MAPDKDRGQRANQPLVAKPKTDQGATTGTTENRLAANKLLSRQVMEALVNDENLIVAQGHFGLYQTTGRLRWLFAALPGARLTINWQVAEDDWVVTGATLRGTHLGEWEGLPPTGKPVTLSIIVRYQIVDSTIMHSEVFMDLLAALEQIGAQLTPRPGA